MQLNVNAVAEIELIYFYVPGSFSLLNFVASHTSTCITLMSRVIEYRAYARPISALVVICYR